MGVALLELLMAFALLSILSVVIFLTMRMTRQAQQAHSREAEKRQLSLATKMRVLDIVRGARLVTPHSDQPQSTILEFQKPEFSGDRLLVGPSGEPVWSDIFVLQVETDGQLVLSRVGGIRPDLISRLGALGQMQIYREPPYVRIVVSFQEDTTTPAEELTIKAYMPDEVLLQR